MRYLARLRVVLTAVSSALCVAVFAVMWSGYNSLNRELESWISTRNESVIHVSLFPRSVLERVSSSDVLANSDLTLFRPPFQDTQSDTTTVISQNQSVLNELLLAELRASPLIAEVVTTQTTMRRAEVGELSFGVLYLSSPSFFDVMDLALSKGTYCDSSRSQNEVVLGAAVNSAIVNDAHGNALQLIPSSRELTVVGVLEETASQHRNSAMDIDAFVFLCGNDDSALYGGVAFPILEAWVQPREGPEREVTGYLRETLESRVAPSTAVQLQPIREQFRMWSGIEMRQRILSGLIAVSVLTLGATVVNIGMLIYTHILQSQWEFGVRRSLGAPRQWILREYVFPYILVGALSGGLGVGLAWLWGPAFLQTSLNNCVVGCSAIVPTVSGNVMFAGWILAVVLWASGGAVAVAASVKIPPVELIGRSHRLLSGLGTQLALGFGFCISIAILVLSSSLRIGSTREIESILGWSGGDRAGSFVDWRTLGDEPRKAIAILATEDYSYLANRFPDSTFGWLGHNLLYPSERILPASANLQYLRPPVMRAGNWFTVQDEVEHKQVIVLGPDLAVELATTFNVTEPDGLIGRDWKGYRIVGVLDSWPGLISMGYLPGVAYSPVDPTDEQQLVGGQVAFLVNPANDFDEALDVIHIAIQARHPEGEVGVILPGLELARLTAWRSGLINLLDLTLSVGLFMGVVGLISTLYMWIVGRSRELVLRRAIGANMFHIGVEVYRIAVLIALTNASLGFLIGWLLSILVNLFLGWPTQIPLEILLMTVFAALLSAALGASLPILTTVRYSIADILRGE